MSRHAMFGLLIGLAVLLAVPAVQADPGAKSAIHWVQPVDSWGFNLNLSPYPYGGYYYNDPYPYYYRSYPRYYYGNRYPYYGNYGFYYRDRDWDRDRYRNWDRRHDRYHDRWDRRHDRYHDRNDRRHR